MKYILFFIIGVSIITLNAAYGYDRSTYAENPERCYSEEFPIDWSGCNLYGKVLPDIDYRYANLSNANLAGAILSGKDLSNADLSGAFLKYAEIDNAILTNADLSNVNIIRGWVRGSDLSNANLSGAYLWNTDFTSSNLRNANFQDATLTYAILAETDLKDANFDGAGTWSTNLNDCYNHPICKKVLLSTSESDKKYHMPDWVENILEWHKQGLISDQEYQNSIEYLVEMGIITEDASKKEIQLMSALAKKNMQLKDHQAKLSLAQQTNLYVSSMNFYESKYNDEFSGVLCKKQNNIVTLSGDYTNDDIYYDTIFFKLNLFDEFGNVVASGLSKIVDVAPKDFRNFSVSTPYKGNIDQCLVMVDSKFIPN